MATVASSIDMPELERHASYSSGTERNCVNQPIESVLHFIVVQHYTLIQDFGQRRKHVLAPKVCPRGTVAIH